ncbi:PucR family transcriptional regulator [Nocardioides seonyuensis]|uniref:PucR family transcriptional regulator n=1 Tax=Nocardioides seonyuensis TaxID=2518371 RepID=A0A4P7IH68_9ACTN|nr:PucR family transcriptional regulator [Nocardioides seonyuensis]QBX56656.1 PucR family transcriptional regulator [Nocardioides seonyuensis]
MAAELPWFSTLSAQHRSWVGLIVQAGIRGFVDWYDAESRGADEPQANAGTLASSVFGAAPRELTGVITLQQTVELVRLSIAVVEANIDDLVDPDDVGDVRSAALRYAREVAFATAEVYARAAESRGAWDARLEALVVDSVVRAEADETVLSRASALGWGAHGDVAVVLGAVPPHRSEVDVFAAVRRSAHEAGMDALCATAGDRLVVVLGGVSEPHKAAGHVVEHFGDGPVVVGPVTADLSHAHASARDALSAHRAALGWPEAPRPVGSLELLPERALSGDGHARRHLVDEVYLPLVGARGTLLETLTAWLAHGASIEGTARALFVHPNTVRYRLRQIEELTGWSPTKPRDALILQIAVILGRQSGRTPRD